MNDPENTVKLPPHDTDAEEAVLGSLLIDFSYLTDLHLEPKDFYYEQNQYVYEAMISVFHRGEAVNQITIARELARCKRLESAGGAARLAYLMSTCPTPLDCLDYSRIVEYLSVNRRMMATADKIAALGYAGNMDINATLTNAENMLFSLRRNGYHQCQVEELWDNAEYEPLKFAAEPLIQMNKPNIWFGIKGSCKTELATATAMIMLPPWLNNSLKLNVCFESMPTLWLDYENDRNTIIERLHKLQMGFDMGSDETHFYVNYRRCWQPLSTEVEQIRKLINETGSKLVVIDSLGIAAGGELKDSVSATRFYGGLRELNITSLILAHTSKDNATKEKTVFGSVVFENLARNIWEVEKLSEEDGSLSTICLHHKATNETRKYDSVGFQFEYQDDRTLIRTHDPKEEPTFVEKMKSSVRIEKQLAIAPASGMELSQTLTMKLATVSQTLKREKEKGKVDKRG